MIRNNLKIHHPKCHYNKKGKAKESFKNEQEGWEFIDKYGLTNKVPYVCKYCGYWHIGEKKE